MQPEYKLHHIGCAVRDVEEAKKYYVDELGYQYKYTIVDDSNNMKACFMEKDGHYMEVIQEINPRKDSAISKILNLLGGGVYHQCYEVPNLEECIERLLIRGFVKLHRRISVTEYFKYIYMITPDNYIMEFLERI